MLENIKLNKILPLTSSAERIKRVDQRKQSGHQTPFKEAFKEKEEKKKKKAEPPGHSEKSETATVIGKTEHSRDDGIHVTKRDRNSANSFSKRIIDIRV